MTSKAKVGGKTLSIGAAFVPIFMVLSAPLPPCSENQAFAESRFSNYEIRVIRPRFFSKVKKFETGVGLMTLTNQSFVYSLLGYANLNWHFSESLAIELSAAYGQSMDKKDKSLLDDSFDISTSLLRTENLAHAKLLFTPAYGKMNLPDGEMLYFDTYVALGVGQTGIRYTYDHCEKPLQYSEEVRSRIPVPPEERLVQYPTASLGLAQRLFLSKDSSAKVGVDIQSFAYNQADGQCASGAPARTKLHENVFLFTGWSKFF
jgi:outer membrane beta-barrel protein